MQFVNGSSINGREKFDIHDAVTMHSQISTTLETLADIGISHNDVSPPNIVLDNNGGFYLIDFGFSWSMKEHLRTHHDLTSMVASQLSIVGTWFFYSRQLFELNHLVHCQQVNVLQFENEIKRLIRTGNQYSLEAVILDKLVSSEGRDSVLKRRMRAIHNDIEKIYRRRKHRKFAMMRQPLLSIWWTREAMLDNYIRSHPEIVPLEKMLFSKLKITRNDTMLMEKAEWTAQTARNLRPCCVGCTLA